MPFKKIFTAIFFISVGMLLNLGFVVQNVFMLIGLTLLVMLVKLLIIFPVTHFLKIGIKNALISGLVLCQVGEFAFILSKAGLDAAILSDFTYQSFLAVSILSMIASAIMIGYTPRIAERLLHSPVLAPIWGKNIPDKISLPTQCELVEHTVIIGFGPSGHRIANLLAKSGEQLSVVELSDRVIGEEDHKIASIIIGNAEDDEVLKRAAIESARQIIITVPQASVAENITSKARKLNHNAKIIVRSRYASEVEHLEKLGANEVIPEEITFAERISSFIVGT
jgi:CPA2 family monovalent cation:H+ antiporter-2